MADLADVSEAIARAQEHPDTLDREIGDFLDREPYEVVTKFDLQRLGYRAVVRLTEDPPRRWQGITRDCVNSIHVALDYIAWELSKPKGSTRTGFPIFASASNWRRHGGAKKVEQLPLAARAAVEGLQPYVRSPARPALDPLWQLYELSIVSKHREPHLTAYLVESSSVTISNSDCSLGINGQADLYVGVTFERETEVLAFRVTDAGPNMHVEMHHEIALDIALAKGGPCAEQKVRPTLQGIVDHVRDVVVPEFAPFY